MFSKLLPRAIGLQLLAILGACAALPPPTEAQVKEALTFATAHAGLPEAPPPPVYLASRSWMAAQIGLAEEYDRVRGLYLFSCRCIYLDEHSWNMHILVHEMVHYLEHAAGVPAGHERAGPVGELWASTAE